jgi:hypothetical protein
VETADLVIDESTRTEFANVAAGLAVLAGVAASDAICCVRLGKRHRGEDHRGAATLLAEAVPDGRKLAGPSSSSSTLRTPHTMARSWWSAGPLSNLSGGPCG